MAATPGPQPAKHPVSAARIPGTRPVERRSDGPESDRRAEEPEGRQLPRLARPAGRRGRGERWRRRPRRRAPRARRGRVRESGRGDEGARRLVERALRRAPPNALEEGLEQAEGAAAGDGAARRTRGVGGEPGTE